MIKKILLIFFSAFIFVVILFISFEWWLSENLVTIINKNPERAYNLDYEDVDLMIILKGIRVERMKIEPLNKKGDKINGYVELAEINGINWIGLLGRNQLNINEVIFNQPYFEIILQQDTIQQKNSKKTRNDIQQLFGDILSRGKIRNFSLTGGGVRILQALDTTYELGNVHNINFKANNIESDSIQWKYPIPFKMGHFAASLDSIHFGINKEMMVSTGKIEFDSEASELAIHHISMHLTDDWLSISKKLGKQIDLIEFDLKRLKINHIDANSNLYGDIDVRAQSIILDSLVFRDHRDKNMPRPRDTEKPMFKGMIESINFPLKVDSIFIRNSHISYTELGENSTTPGAIHFNRLYGTIYNVTTLPEYQSSYTQFEADIFSQVNGRSKLNLRLEVPYETEMFNLKATLDTFQVEDLNQTILPLAGVDATSGTIHRMELTMTASKSTSSNELALDYENLRIIVTKAENQNNYKKEKFLTSLANFATKSNNLPGQKNHTIASYQTERNVSRGPFNFMWQSVKEGIAQIVLTKSTISLIGNKKKKD